MKKIPDNQIAFYQAQNGGVHIEVLYAEENIWLSQKKMAELFDTTPQNITQHLKNIYNEKEIDQKTTCKDFLQVQNEGGRDVERKSKMYSLEVIIAIGYRVNSERGTQFRQWAMGILKNYIHKGYALNYLEKGELSQLDRIGNMYLDYAEMQATRGKAMTMSDWVLKLNSFLKFSEYDILNNAGKISHEVAESLALGEYEKYRIKQDKSYISDFDEVFLKLKDKK